MWMAHIDGHPVWQLTVLAYFQTSIGQFCKVCITIFVVFLLPGIALFFSGVNFLIVIDSLMHTRYRVNVTAQ